MSGSAYDALEYYKFLKNMGYDVCCLLLLDIDKEKVIENFESRYFLNDNENLYILPFQSTIMPKIKCNLLISTSTFSMSQVILKPILIRYNKAFMFHETTYDTKYVVDAFDGRYNEKIVMIRDDRCFGILPLYDHISYKKKLYFDIFKPIDRDKVRNVCLINMATLHKLQSQEVIYNAIEHFQQNEYIIYTQKKTYDRYKDMNNSYISVVVAPIKDYLYQFDSFIYFQSNRGQDPSPRIIPETMFYGKELYFYNYDKSVKDGAYYRIKDCMNDFDSIVLKENDEILDMINERI